MDCSTFNLIVLLHYVRVTTAGKRRILSRCKSDTLAAVGSVHTPSAAL